MRSLRHQGASKIVVAVPVAPKDTLQELSHLADEIVCVLVPRNFSAVGQFYEHFDQTDDEEVINIMRRQAEKQSRTQTDVGLNKADAEKQQQSGKDRDEAKAGKEENQYRTGREV